MRVAVATWNGRISPVFDVARQIMLLDFENGQEVSRRQETLPGTDPWAQTARLGALGVGVLICGAISRPMLALLTRKGVEVIPFTAGPVEDVLAAWRAGRLPNPALTMPGCYRRRRRWCHGPGPQEGGPRGLRGKASPGGSGFPWS
ncbi:MAG: NifB/NifX family molybdenum-iron cluster-binding protein [Kiritimatiellia bacterium]